MASFQERLNKFNKQQEKCQSTLTNIAAKAGSSRPMPATPASAKPPAPAVKFSDDIERLQLINRQKKVSAVGAQIKRVIDLLFQTRRAYTIEQINEQCCVDTNAVFNSLTKNPKVHYDGKRFSYKAKYPLKNKEELLVLIRKFIEGIPIVDLTDSYPTVMEDLQSLKAEGQVWLLANSDSKEDIAYPNDKRSFITVDDDIKKIFREIELPLDMLDIERDLQKNKMKPATDTAKRRAMAQLQGVVNKPKTKKKNKEISKRTKLTNAHLPELFSNLNKASGSK